MRARAPSALAVARQVESLIALALAIGACGLAAAVWLRQLAPLANQLGLS